MGYARLEAEGLIVGTQEWKQRQTEKATERLLRLLNGEIDTDCNITFSYASRKTEEERREEIKKHIEDIKESYPKSAQKVGVIY